jgi:signal transduction histidine kinase
VKRRREIKSQPQADSFDIIEFADGRIFEVYSRPRRIGESTDGRVWSTRDVTGRSRAERELRNRTRRLELHNDLLVRLARQRLPTDGRHSVFGEITEAAAKRLETQRVSVWLYEADRNCIRVADLFDPEEARHEEGEQIGRDEAPDYFMALEEERALAIDDVRSDPRTVELRAYCERHRISSMLDAPIRAGGQFVGVACFERRRPHHWTIEDIAFAGSIADLAAIALETASRRRAEWGMRFMAEASSILPSSLDYRTTIGNVAQLAIPALAEWCVVDVIQDGQIRRVASRHSDGAKNDLLRDLERRYQPDWNSPQPSALALREGKAELVSEVTEEVLAARTRDVEHRHLLAELVLGFNMPVPLGARSRTLGVITFASGTRSFDDDDLSLAVDLAGRAATAMDNADLYERAQASNTAKNSFLALMSHELRTPLTAILGYADLMLIEVTGPSLPPRQQEHLQRIKARSLDLVRIIDEILAFAQLEAGVEHPDQALVDLTDLLREVVEQHRPTVENAGLEFRVHLPESPLPAETDPKRVEHILTNLISNAVRFTDHGSIALDAKPVDGHVQISVSDTGTGIEPRFVERVFEPFFQVEDAMTREKEGTGLGLAVARRFAKLLGGDIRLDSTPGKGSTFTLDIPVRGGETTVDGPGTGMRSTDVFETPGRRRRATPGAADRSETLP